MKETDTEAIKQKLRRERERDGEQKEREKAERKKVVQLTCLQEANLYKNINVYQIKMLSNWLENSIETSPKKFSTKK